MTNGRKIRSAQRKINKQLNILEDACNELRDGQRKWWGFLSKEHYELAQDIVISTELLCIYEIKEAIDANKFDEAKALIIKGHVWLKDLRVTYFRLLCENWIIPTKYRNGVRVNKADLVRILETFI